MTSRYNRQELLSFIGQAGQRKLLKSAAAVICLGALGTVAAELLARSGVGRLIIVDRDIVELTDLQRQLLYDESDIGKPKAAAAADKLKRINSGISVAAAANDIGYKNIASIIGKPAVILDCTDNMETRFLINEYCLKNRLAWVHAAAIRETGQLAVFDFRGNDRRKPCYACIFGNSAAEGTCDTVGVLVAATAAIASLQAAEAIKLLTGKATAPNLRRLNVWDSNFVGIDVKKKSNCGSCGMENYDYLSGKKGSKIASLCGKDAYQVKGKPVDIAALKLRLQKIGAVSDFGDCISFRNITAFKDGRALVKAKSAKEAKSTYSKYVGA